MEKTSYLASTTIKLGDLLVKWEGVITSLVTFCGVVAVALGILWLFLRKDTLLFTVLGFSACYLIGRNFREFRSRRIVLEN